MRYFEDSTLVSPLVNPARPPADPEALALQRPSDGRWVTADCAETQPAACLSGDTWPVTGPVAFADADLACAAEPGSTCRAPATRTPSCTR